LLVVIINKAKQPPPLVMW